MSSVYNCPVISCTMLNCTCADIRVFAPEICGEAVPGQFVHIKCDGLTLRRPISICDVDGAVLRLIVDSRGKGTEWLVSRKKGDILDILGPLGHGFDCSGESILVVGGGIGVPPLLYAAKKASDSCAVIGFRSEDQAILLGDFSQACRAIHIATDDGSLGHKGFVDHLARLKLESEHFDRVLACGPTPMLRSVAKVCEEMNVPLQVSLEERMGCGVGACLVCACKTKADNEEGFVHSHVCKDGPVFDANEVIWE